MFRKILLACDVSPQSLAASRAGIELAARMGSEAVALFVVGTDITELPAMAMGEDKIAQHRQEGEEVLLRASDEGKRMGVRVKAILKQGAVAEEIVQAAQGEACDLIVMSTYNHNVLMRLLLGDAAVSVLRHAPCPVLVYPLQPEPLKEGEEEPAKQAAIGMIGPNISPA